MKQTHKTVEISRYSTFKNASENIFWIIPGKVSHNLLSYTKRFSRSLTCRPKFTKYIPMLGYHAVEPFATGVCSIYYLAKVS